MAQIQVPLTLPGGDVVKFTFSFPAGIVPGMPFPENKLANGSISLASVSAKADKEFKIGESGKSITFGIGAEGLAALGVYRKPADLLRDLTTEGFDESIANLNNFNIASTDNLLALRWGYGLEANAKGNVAFGPGGSLGFAGDARTTAVSAILRARPQSETALESIVDTLRAWRVPGQISRADDIPAKTSIITESSGKLSLSLGVQYGYSYNWVKEGLSIGELKGDLGLKIQAGINARLGFTAEGRYALALTRESSKRQLRVQVFRLRQRGWSFAFNSGVSAQLQKTPLIPKSFDEFIKGVFNVHGQQVIKDIEKWLDTDKKLADLLGDAAVDYGGEMFQDITGFDPIDEAEKFADKLKGFIDRWNDLPSEATSLLYGWLDERTGLNDLRAFLKKIVQHANSPQSLVKEITGQVTRIDFFDNPIGKWLTAVAEREVLSLLANIDDERTQLVKYAKTTLSFLDGGELNKALTTLQKWVNEKIGLEKLEAVLDIDIENWLKKRLSDFLGRTPLVEDLEKIREAIAAIRSQWDAFYKRGYDALMDMYNVDLNYSFQSSTTKDALIDLSIDFTKPDAEEHLANAIAGDFGRLLADPLEGVTLHTAVLTHGIKRRSHLEVDAPFHKMGLDQINESMASAKGVDTSDGRMWVFNLKAFDIKRRRKTLSQLSISAQFATSSGNVRVFDSEAFQANYKFMLADKKASVRFVERRMELGADTYLRPSFPSGSSFSDYLIEIDKFLDKHNVEGLGNIFATLTVSVPGRALSAFKLLPRDLKDSVYKRISVTVQSFLRRVVPLGYIYESRVFEREDRVYPLLVYSALPLFSPPEPESPGVFYWNFRDDTTRMRVVTGDTCKTNLRGLLQRYRPDIPESARDSYEDKDVESIAWKTAAPKAQMRPEVVNFLNLCDLEYSILRGVAKSAKFLHRFLDSNDRAEQIESLAKFGSEFTETFNEDLGGDYAGKSLRPLGGLLLLEIARLLDDSLRSLTPTAMLEMMIVKPDIDFDPASLLDGKLPKETDLLLHQRILNAS